MVLDLLADCLVWWRRAREDLATHGWKDRETGEARRLVERAASLRREAFDYLRELGRTPRSRVALGLDLARGRLDAANALAAAREEPDPALRRALLAAAGLVDADDDGDTDG